MGEYNNQVKFKLYGFYYWQKYPQVRLLEDTFYFLINIVKLNHVSNLAEYKMTIEELFQ
jgi:hypothetical protein